MILPPSGHRAFADASWPRGNLASIIGALEDAEDYKAFEEAITADYGAQSAVERELVLRLASLLWRLRRATTMETGLFDIQADHLKEFRQARQALPASRDGIDKLFGQADPASPDFANETEVAPERNPIGLAVDPAVEHALLFASGQSAQFRARSPQPL
jgi:hypothetical protein